MTVPNETAPLSFTGAETSQRAPGSSAGAGETAAIAKDQASGVAGAAADNARAVASEASTQTKAVVAQAKDQVQSLASQTKGELLTQAESKGQQAVAGLRTLSDQINALSSGRPEAAGPLTQYLGEAQDKISSIASRLEQGGPQGVLDDLTAYARRRPGMFLLGAVGAGVVVGRMVRSGKAAASEHQSDAGRSFAAPTRQPAISSGDQYSTGAWASSPPTGVTGSSYTGGSVGQPSDATLVAGEVLITPTTAADGDRLDTLP